MTEVELKAIFAFLHHEFNKDDLLVELLEIIGYKKITKLYQEEQEYFWYS